MAGIQERGGSSGIPFRYDARKRASVWRIDAHEIVVGCCGPAGCRPC
jgi:hypothetical protein